MILAPGLELDMMIQSDLQETALVHEKKVPTITDVQGLRFLQAYGMNVSMQPEPQYSLDTF